MGLVFLICLAQVHNVGADGRGDQKIVSKSGFEASLPTHPGTPDSREIPHFSPTGRGWNTGVAGFSAFAQRSILTNRHFRYSNCRETPNEIPWKSAKNLFLKGVRPSSLHYGDNSMIL
jgi:hypothetical protein